MEDVFGAHVDTIIQDILSKDERVAEQGGGVSTSHLMWMRREVTKLIRKDLALSEREVKLASLEEDIRSLKEEVRRDKQQAGGGHGGMGGTGGTGGGGGPRSSKKDRKAKNNKE